MRIGIDFGTSYSAAAAVVDGAVKLIEFEGNSQFRTTVFFPHQLPNLQDFVLTDELQAQAQRLAAELKADQSRELARIAALRRDAERLTEQERSNALAMIPTLKAQGDSSFYDAAVGSVRRDWARGEVIAARAQSASIKDALYGEEAMKAFMRSGEGHLVVSPKSMLGYALLPSARETLLSISTHILSYIRETASAQLGTDVRKAVLGRPVAFRSSQGEAGNEMALSILTDAAMAAGFEEVSFLEEPAAAAFEHHRQVELPTRVLIFDIGGGTTDIAMARVGGDLPAPEILASWGEPRGGTDVDLELSLKGVMPLFGKHVTSTPVHFYAWAASVHDAKQQRDFQVADFCLIDEPYRARLVALQCPGHTVRLNRSVERARINLGSDSRRRLKLSYIEDGLTCPLDHQLLEQASEDLSQRLEQLLRTAKEQASCAPDIVLLTGGMSQAAMIPSLVEKVFPGIPIFRGDASLAVVTGLAWAAGADGGAQA
ncbi:MAG: heat-shock protein Hsp70 [Stenotrophomonas sp.]|nr:MAG: heat-shock protein Hsp70 [Stenotrophomonas sp.]